MKKILPVTVFVCCMAAGCESLRFTATETQKQNAWLHARTAQLAADRAIAENTSEQLQQLTALSTLQSNAFVYDYGMPKELPAAATAEQVLAESNWNLADSAASDSQRRPDAWQLADSAIELGIGIAALLGGVYGTKAVSLLRTAQAKSKALREIIAGNELFKKQNAEAAAAFKQAQAHQSPQTRQLVAATKAGNSVIGA